MSECVVRMEMPKNCGCCPMVFTADVPGYHWCAALEQEVEEGLSRPKECPIICQLPEGHGRLVDADVQLEIQASFDGGAFRWQDGQDLMDRINEIPAASPWHRVENGLPEESKEYIVYLQMGTGVEAPDCLGKVDLSYVTSMYFKKEKGLWFDEYDESYSGDLSLVDTVNDYHVTHWMPLPEPPQEE